MKLLKLPFLFTLECDLDADHIEDRLLKRPAIGELTAIILAISMIVFISLLTPYEPDPVDGSGIGFDWRIFQVTANGAEDYYGFYFYLPYWVLPIIYVIGQIGDPLGYFVWNMLNLLGVWLAGRVFGGKIPPLVLSFQMVWLVMAGQITGIMLGGLALFWWALHRKRWHLAGAASLLSVSKFHWGIPLTLAIWLLLPETWQERFKILILPSIVALISLIIYPLWIVDLVNIILNAPPEASASVSMWEWLSIGALLFWIPVFILPLEVDRRIMAIAATVPLAMPYFQQADLVVLFSMPVGWIGWLGQLGWVLLSIDSEFTVLRWLTFIPLIVYLRIMWPPLQAAIARRSIR